MGLLYIRSMKWVERVAGHVGTETVVAAGLFQRRGTSAMIGGESGLPSGATPESAAPGFPSNTILAVTDAPALHAFHRNPTDGLIGRWPLGEVGALSRNLPAPRSLDPEFTDWDPDDISTWDERIVMVADDDDFAEMRQEWLAKKTADAQAKTGLRARIKALFGTPTSR
jgi:hypothetical protein